MTTAPPPYLRSTRMLRNVRVPMRDGVELATNVYLPTGEGEKFPVVLLRTAYNRSLYGTDFFCTRGMALVVQDVRGRYGSDGEFRPWLDEESDGLDTLDWIAAQPWCNGRVGMFGDSYLGGVQFALIHTNHPAMVAFNPRFVAADLWRQGFHCDGVFSLALTMSWLVLEVQGRTAEANLLPLLNIDALFRELPVVDLDVKSGARAPWYREYVSHVARDRFWQDQSWIENCAKCRVPTLLTAGWYDYYPNEAFRAYESLLAGDAPPEIKQSHRVLIGPWTHGVSGTSKLGELDYGAEACKENDHTNRWLETMLKGGKTSDYQRAPIRIFVMGQNVWRDEHEWPLARTRWTDFYLHSRGGANTAGGDGTLSTDKPADEPPDTYAYDPADPVLTRGGNHSVGPYNPGLYELSLPGPYDQKIAESRSDVLVYTTAPLERDTEVTGPIWVHLFAKTDGRDTDFAARLCDVYPDDRSMNITEGVIRGRFWKRRWDTTELLEPGRVYEFRIELQPTANVFRRGHRIRLQITSSNFPLWDRNLNTGDDPATGTTMRVAHQTILHDARHPSRLVLPLIPR